MLNWKSFRKIISKLKSTGLDKNTIVVFTSDHGYHLGEKGHWQKQTLYDRATRVPLIISGPGIITNKRTNSPVELVDLYKTLMDLTGISVPGFVQGYSLKNILTSNSKPIRKSALSELRVYSNSALAQGYSIITDRPNGNIKGNDILSFMIISMTLMKIKILYTMRITIKSKIHWKLF